MQPEEAGEVMHSRKEPCRVPASALCLQALLVSSRHYAEQPTECANTAPQQQALC